MAHPPAKTGNDEFSINTFTHLLLLLCRLLLFVDEADAFLRKRNQVKSSEPLRLFWCERIFGLSTELITKGK